MRVVIQRVNYAKVETENKTEEIKKGLCILAGIEDADSEDDLIWLSAKIVKLRIFNDSNNVMNLSVTEINGEILIVSQFTLHASTKKGNRPSYIKAARPEKAIPLYEKFIEQVEKDCGIKPKTGEFGAHMRLGIENDGPVTIIIDSKNRE